MRHLDEGTLRHLLDEPLAAPVRVREHLAACEQCRDRANAIAADARDVGRALSAAGDRGDARAAFSQFNERAAAAQTKAVPLGDRVADLWLWRARPYAGYVAAAVIAAAAVVALLFTPAGTLAQNFLTIFEPQQFVAIPVTGAEFEYLPDLQNFGTIVDHRPVDRTGMPIGEREVSGPAAAAALAGFPVKTPAWVPESVPRTAHYIVMPRGSGSFIFSAARARAYAASTRRAMPAMPPGLDGSTLTLQVGPMVAIGFGSLPAHRESAGRPMRHNEDESDMHLPPLVIVEAIAPRVTSTGATARDIESYILQMPGVSPQLAAEIRAIGDPSTTMPIPVPIDKAFAQNVAVDGVRGLGVGDNTGVGGIIIWQKGGIVYGVGGALPQRDLMEVAQSLR